MIVGGGTAGHVVPAIAIGQALVDRGRPAADILFVGARRGIEARLVPEAGFDIVLLPGRGIARRLAVENIAAVAGLLVAFVRAIALALRRRPAVVVSMGGFAAAPAAFAAILTRIPLVLAEQNAIPTSTHRLVARFARASAVSFPGTPLPRATVTGNPVSETFRRTDFSAAGRQRARQELGLPPDRTVLLVTGGSLGARRINRAAADLAQRWRHRDDVAIRHVIGERDWEQFGATGDAASGGIVYQRVRYEVRMPLAMAAADLVIGRAGGTTAELGIAGRAAILVPLPIAPYDHQTFNAKAFVDVDAGILIPDGELDVDRLEKEVAALLGEPGRVAQMGDRARRLGHPDAAERVAELVEQSARRA
jgi:undecaprenyldiphospho-muramoylpentapeptide beta-N-acetylglucosaminyltransferase